MLEPNAFFGKYCIVRLVGRGGMGVVYLAEDTMLGRQVALKILDQGFTADRSFAERFRDEARFIASLEHPHIVGIHALEKVGDIWCIDMPFVRGGSLLDAFAASALTPTQVVRLCGQVLDALSCCHHSGMIHRDIKPANILLTDNSDAMISDFGLAKLLAEEQNALINSGSSSGMFMGTPKYAPPESWDGYQPTPAWDVYSVGMILYEGIAGSSPYTAESPLALMKQMVSSSIPPLSEVKAGVSEPLSALVGRMLSSDPEVRPRTGSESLEQLMTTPEFGAAGENGAVTVVSRIRHGRRLPRGSRRYGVWAQRAVLVMLLIVLAGFGGMWSWTRLLEEFPQPAAVEATLPEDGWACALLNVSAASGLASHGYCVNQNGGWALAAYGPTHLWMMTLRPETSGQWSVEGYWAAYTDEAARFFSHGTLIGTGRWIEDGTVLSVEVEFRNAQDASRRTQSLVVKRSAGTETRELFVARMAEGASVQPLLYNELIPRRLNWAEVFEREWLGAAAPHATVPFLAGEGVQMDGVLNEAAWRGVASETNADGGLIPSEGGVLRVRYDEASLCLGISIPERIDQPEVTVSILDRFLLPVRESSVYHAEFVQDAQSSIRHIVRNRQLPWDCPWELKSGQDEHGWSCEIRVPFDDATFLAPPAAEDRWRLLCSVKDGDAPERAPIFRGPRNATEPWQGIILSFGAQSARQARQP